MSDNEQDALLDYVRQAAEQIRGEKLMSTVRVKRENGRYLFSFCRKGIISRTEPRCTPDGWTPPPFVIPDMIQRFSFAAEVLDDIAADTVQLLRTAMDTYHGTFFG